MELPWMLANAAVFAFGAITLIFAAMTRYPSEASWKWDPRKLPRVPPGRRATGSQPVRRYTAIFEVLAAIVVSVLWVDIVWVQNTLTIGETEVALAPVWRRLFWPLLAVMLSGIPVGILPWQQPWWIRARSLARLVVDGVTLVLLGALVNMGPWVTITAANATPEMNHWANVSFRRRSESRRCSR